jgi:FG-GAP-like repeat
MPIRFLGSDFQINILDTSSGTGIAGNQILSQVTTLSDGRFAVVYQSDFQGNSADTDPVEALFDNSGNFSSPATTIIYSAHGAPGLQTQPVVTARPGGGFGIAFTNVLHADGTADANGTNITYVPIAASGQPGLPLAVADFNDPLLNPAIATLSTGSQIVVFERVFTPGTDDDIYLNVVSASGLTTAFTAINPLTVASSLSWEANPALATIGNSALIAYEDAAGTTQASANISVRLFNGGNDSLGSALTIADHANRLIEPKVAALDDHRYVIIYVDQGATYDIFGRIYDTSGPGLSAEFEIDQPGNFDFLPAIAATSDGGFLVTWTRILDGNYDVLGRRYNSDGTAMGQQFTVNRLTDSGQDYSTVAISGANAFFNWTDIASRPNDASPTSVRGQMMSLTTPPDFNDNGISDILWRNDAGQLALWDINSGGAIAGSGFLTAGGSVVSPGASWSVGAISDFSGDGRADVLWRDTGGQTALWTMNGNAIVASASLTAGGAAVNPDPSWSVAGAGDFNGDGMSDILWRSSSGQLALWQMNGASITASSSVTAGGAPVNPDPSWSVAGLGDFDGDGMSDILWRSAAGEVAVWTMNGSTIVGGGDTSVGGTAVRPGPTWSIAGVGDFNADGNADILWRDSASNALVVWLMNGASIISSGAVTANGAGMSPDASWHVVEIGDFNDDARADILWRNDNGALAEWQMKGTSIIASVAPDAAPDASWHTQAKPTDFA